MNNLCLKLGRRRQTHSPPPTAGGGGCGMAVTEDTPPDMLAGSMNLQLVLPDGNRTVVPVQRRTAMMDLLVTVTTSHKLSVAGHALQPYGHHGVLPYKPNTPIGALDVVAVHIVSKSQVSGQHSNKVTLKQLSQPFDITQRIQVRLPRNQLYVLRAKARTTIADILLEVCSEKNLDPNKYSLRHPKKMGEALAGPLTVAEYQHNELVLVSHREATTLSTEDIISALGRHHYSGDCNSRSLSPDSSVSPPAPVPPRKKKPPAPKPPVDNKSSASAPPANTSSKNHSSKSHKKTEGESSGAGVFHHSRTSSDSSGYHEPSLISGLDSSPPNSNNSLPDSLPRRSKLTEPSSNLSRSLSNLSPSGATSSVRPAVSTSSLNHAGRKKRPAPAPPAPMVTVQEEKERRRSEEEAKPAVKEEAEGEEIGRRETEKNDALFTITDEDIDRIFEGATEGAVDFTSDSGHSSDTNNEILQGTQGENQWSKSPDPVKENERPKADKTKVPSLTSPVVAPQKDVRSSSTQNILSDQQEVTKENKEELYASVVKKDCRNKVRINEKMTANVQNESEMVANVSKTKPFKIECRNSQNESADISEISENKRDFSESEKPSDKNKQNINKKIENFESVERETTVTISHVSIHQEERQKFKQGNLKCSYSDIEEGTPTKKGTQAQEGVGSALSDSDAVKKQHCQEQKSEVVRRQGRNDNGGSSDEKIRPASNHEPIDGIGKSCCPTETADNVQERMNRDVKKFVEERINRLERQGMVQDFREEKSKNEDYSELQGGRAAVMSELSSVIALRSTLPRPSHDKGPSESLSSLENFQLRPYTGRTPVRRTASTLPSRAEVNFSSSKGSSVEDGLQSVQLLKSILGRKPTENRILSRSMVDLSEMPSESDAQQSSSNEEPEIIPVVEKIPSENVSIPEKVENVTTEKHMPDSAQKDNQGADICEKITKFEQELNGVKMEKRTKRETSADRNSCPAFAFSTWGDRPKRQVSIKSDRDYVFGLKKEQKEPEEPREPQRRSPEKCDKKTSVYRDLDTGNTRPLRQILDDSRVPVVRAVELKPPYRDERQVLREIRGVDRLTTFFEPRDDDCRPKIVDMEFREARSLNRGPRIVDAHFGDRSCFKSSIDAESETHLKCSSSSNETKPPDPPEVEQKCEVSSFNGLENCDVKLNANSQSIKVKTFQPASISEDSGPFNSLTTIKPCMCSENFDLAVNQDDCFEETRSRETEENIPLHGVYSQDNNVSAQENSTEKKIKRIEIITNSLNESMNGRSDSSCVVEKPIEKTELFHKIKLRPAGLGNKSRTDGLSYTGAVSSEPDSIGSSQKTKNQVSTFRSTFEGPKVIETREIMERVSVKTRVQEVNSSRSDFSSRTQVKQEEIRSEPAKTRVSVKDAYRPDSDSSVKLPGKYKFGDPVEPATKLKSRFTSVVGINSTAPSVRIRVESEPKENISRDKSLPRVKKDENLDPRDNLLNAIRSFGGISSLRKVS